MPSRRPVERVCVFCGSSRGSDPAYGVAAEEVGAELARRALTLVYGGGAVGLMGVVADAVLAEGGAVTGVIPGFLQRREIVHTGVTDLRVVESMHERKALMADLADAFIVLPGGIGTFEEMFEAMTWTQLGLQDKPSRSSTWPTSGLPSSSCSTGR
ncbi:MAG: TIGR00730 family Rossman fold protein [Acidimicrobiales bacterium]